MNGAGSSPAMLARRAGNSDSKRVSIGDGTYVLSSRGAAAWSLAVAYAPAPASLPAGIYIGIPIIFALLFFENSTWLYTTG